MVYSREKSVEFLEERNTRFRTIAPNDPAFSDQLFGNYHER
jgi:hypothetical protein